MKKPGKKHPMVWRVLLCLFAALVVASLIFTHFGGFGTGESADPEAFAAYAGTVEDISIPQNATIIALGEATHGNREFQQLKLDVLRHLVETYGVRAFALEGDYGGCEQVNRYIHGGEGTAQQAAAAIGFAIYRTEQMAELISYMRQYNDSAAEGDDLRFYGYDMQRCDFNARFLVEACREVGVKSADLEKLVDDGNWSDAYDTAARTQILTQVKADLEGARATAQAIHFADILLQNCELQRTSGTDQGITLRDRLMAENAQWIADRERDAGHERIFLSGHNGHVARYGSYDAMGKLLANALGEGYYVIGTDFFKTNCNLPVGADGKRTNQVFYSHDPLSKAAKMAGLDIAWLDFTKASESPDLAPILSQYTYMGSLGETYAWFMRLLPPSYRIFQPPAELYDGMIYVAEANPTAIINEE